MRVGIMQPYFLPYIGYFQLIAAVDVFVIYDNIKFTKKGWINRNRMLKNGRDSLFSLPLATASDHLFVVERHLADSFRRDKLLNSIKEAYRKAPYFEEVFPLLRQIILNPENNLFAYIKNSILEICRYLHLETKILVSSELAIDHSLKAQDKVIAICRELGATNYINAIGGVELYSKAAFESQGMSLCFIKTMPVEYAQFEHEFIPFLSMLDVLMFNSVEHIQLKLATEFELL
jgi:hypothetical protein